MGRVESRHDRGPVALTSVSEITPNLIHPDNSPSGSDLIVDEGEEGTVGRSGADSRRKCFIGWRAPEKRQSCCGRWTGSEHWKRAVSDTPCAWEAKEVRRVSGALHYCGSDGSEGVSDVVVGAER